jgi:cell volume regulation protein A
VDTLTNQLILLMGLLFLLCVLASVVSARIGMPLLLVFLAIGMLVGEDGPGGISFDDVETTYRIGTLTLAVILFNGGLCTDVRSFRVGLWPALWLATVGVVITGLIAGLAAAWFLQLPWLEGLLIGAMGLYRRRRRLFHPALARPATEGTSRCHPAD